MIAMGKRLVLIFAVLWLAACGEIKIDQPQDKSVAPTQPELFQVTFVKGSIPAGLKIVLNTHDVTSLFTVTATGATATGATLQDYIFSGRNQFSVAATGVVKKEITFYYDTEGPAVHILEGKRSDGSVSGYLSDVGGVASLTIDGASISLDAKNNFSTIVQNLPFNTLVTTDRFGNSTSMQLARNDQEFVPAMSARLSNTGLGFLGDVLEEALGNVDFEALTKSINPLLYMNFIGLFDVSVKVKNLSFDKPVIDLEVQNDNRIQAHVDIPNLSIGMTLGGHSGIWPLQIPWSVGGTMYFKSIVVDTSVLLGIANKDLSVNLRGTKAKLVGQRLDLDYIPNFLGFEDRLGEIVGGVGNVLMPIFTGAVDNVFVPVISDFIRDIPIKLTMTTPDQKKLTIKALPTYLETFDRSLTIDLGASVRAPEPFAGAVPQWGSLYSEGDTPTISGTTPKGKSYDIGAAISANLINQALFAAHESGITTMTLRPDNTAGTNPEGVSVVQGEGDDIQVNDLIGLRIEPASAPFIKLLDREGAYGVLGWYDFKIAFDMKRVGWSDYKQVFSMKLNLEIPFELGATDDGFLQIGLEQLPLIDILDTEYKGLIPLTPRFMNGVVQRFMPVIMPAIAAKLKAIPLPRIAGHSIHPDEFWISGAGKNNLSLAGSLVKLSTTAAAPAPKTMLAYSTSNDTVTGSAAPAAGAKVARAASVTQSDIVIANGKVKIDISGNNPSADLGKLESRFRVDNGAWSVWKPRGKIELSNLLGGDHVVEVCSRTVLMKQEQGCPTVEFTTSVQP
ncbi:hypothetical protein HDN1F_09160 [gamma proteobacterium HdN1]|nr:hypothetical protein HDN1F_09160 [gamma proteobacterium HdN1]